LIVNADAVLPHSITYQRFETITRRRFQVLEHGCRLQHRELSSSDLAYRAETTRFPCPEKLFGILTFESLNCHIRILYRFPVSGKFCLTRGEGDRGW
jgi:hypothetical protein